MRIFTTVPSLSIPKFVPGVPAFNAPAPIPNVYAVPAVNGVSVE